MRDAPLNMRRYHVSVPTGRSGAITVERFVVTEYSPENLRLALHGRTPISPGLYTKMCENGAIWMSDTDEEIETHQPAFAAFFRAPPESRVLIHGLGLGMIVQEAIRTPNIRKIDVVELNPDVIRLVAPHYQRMAEKHDKTLTIIEANCFTYRWPVHSRWYAVWHDIWQSYGEDNLGEMDFLKRSFGHRTRWQGCWGQETCRRIRDGRYHREHERIMRRFYVQMGLPKNMEEFNKMLKASGMNGNEAESDVRAEPTAPSKAL